MIDSFTGYYFFLSNFSPAIVYLWGKQYPTTEHAYQAAKFWKNDSVREKIRLATTPAEAKRLGRGRPITTPNWEYNKCIIMLELLRRKFDISSLKAKLLETKNEELIEGNWWKDTFWGMCDGDGGNMLGKMLMFIRREYVVGQQPTCPVCGAYVFLSPGGIQCINRHGGVLSDAWYLDPIF